MEYNSIKPKSDTPEISQDLPEISQDGEDRRRQEYYSLCQTSSVRKYA